MLRFNLGVGGAGPEKGWCLMLMDLKSWRHDRWRQGAAGAIEGGTTPQSRWRYRNKGSAVLLVVVAMSLMAVMGAVYLQSVQKEVNSTSQLKKGGHIDEVVDAAIGQIKQALKDDLMDENGNFFTETDGDEAYDYPWTNFTNQSPEGGEFDDRWLASTAPDFSAVAKWEHLTNLNGVYLGTDASGNLEIDESDSLPKEEFVTGGEDTDVAFDSTDSTYLVDADGDGIGDSRWTWAPVKEIDGKVYVMAVRIIDNSAMVNVNVALSQVDNAGQFDTSGANAPRWWNPAELDLGRFVWEISAHDAAKMSELQNLLGYRLGNTGVGIPVLWNDRKAFWGNGPAMYGNFQNPYRSLTIDDELELRYRNGLNNLDNKSLIETDKDLDEDQDGDQSGLHMFLRQAATSETSWDKAPYGSVQEFFENEPRHQMTVVSGASLYAMLLPKERGDGVSRRIKMDLNGKGGGISIGNRWNITDELSRIISEGDFDLPSFYAGDNQGFADQFAVDIVDYADEDNLFTRISRGEGESTQSRYGMESLPFITEVYVQGLYKVENVRGSPGNWLIDWKREGNAGFAIEIRNPFDRSISLQNVYLVVGGVNWGPLWDSKNIDNGLAVNSERGYLAPRATLILYKHSTEINGVPANVEDNIEVLFSPGTEGRPVRIAKINNKDKTWPETDDSKNIQIELRATETDVEGNPKTEPLDWAYMAVKIEGMPETILNQSVTFDGDPHGAWDYRQRAYLGNGNGLNMLTVRPNEVKRVPEDLNINPDKKPIRSLVLDKLGEENKGGPGDHLGGNQQFHISDRGFVAQVGELAHIAILPLDGTKTIAEAWEDDWGNPTDMNVFLLDFNSSNLVGTEGDLAVPHAVMMLNRFTTLSPLADSRDNDGDGPTAKDYDGNNDGIPGEVGDEFDEVFVPGTINLNTAPRVLLEKILPIPDDPVLNEVLDAIREYRDYPLMRTEPRRSEPGIAGMGELMICLRNKSLGSDGVDNWRLPDQNDGIPIDFQSDDGVERPQTDGISDDREEQAMVAKWLMQTCSTRSDIFTAYVLIQGYEKGKYSKPVEAARFFVVLDRSQVADENKDVRVLGAYRYK